MLQIEKFETSDMAVVTFLRVSGKVHVSGGWRSGRPPSYWWCFALDDEVKELVRIYEASEAKVDPREYSQEFGRVKAELFGSLRSRG